jgi:hypothetical protein
MSHGELKKVLLKTAKERMSESGRLLTSVLKALERAKAICTAE